MSEKRTIVMSCKEVVGERKLGDYLKEVRKVEKEG
jgi:hypothetical protein